MSHCRKIHKLIDRMEVLVKAIGDQRDLAVHHQVDQFFYMQKIEELRVLLDQFNELTTSLESVTSKIHARYDLCLAHWRRDARWINARHCLTKPGPFN